MLTLERPKTYIDNINENSIIKNLSISPYENVSFDLERMTAMLDTDFIPVPKFDNNKDLVNWIESGVK